MDAQTETESIIGPLIELLNSTEDKVRGQARKKLVALGNPAVDSLIFTLENSVVVNARWEAAKALGAIGNVKAIPSLVKSLEDREADIAWLSADALKNFRKAAWPKLFSALASRGTESVKLRNAAHNVLWKQREDGYNEMLNILRKALEPGSIPKNTAEAANNLIEKMIECRDFDEESL